MNAPKITPQDIKDNIVSVHYFRAAEGCLGAAVVAALKASSGQVEKAIETALGSEEVPQPLLLLTFCVLVLKNGFTVTGESACVSKENFDEEKGKQVAYDNAIDKVWPLMGYALKQQLSEQL